MKTQINISDAELSMQEKGYKKRAIERVLSLIDDFNKGFMELSDLVGQVSLEEFLISKGITF